MSFNDLFNPSFLIFLGILVLVVSLLIVYFESKMREQNHKIASMLSLVSTLAEDMNGVKFGLNHLSFASIGGSNPQQNLKHLDESNITLNLNKNDSLINVSDDDSDDESNSDDSEESFDEINNDSNSEDSFDDLNDDSDNDDTVDENNELQESDIKIFKLNISNKINDDNDDFDNDDFDNINDIDENNDIENIDDLEELDDNLSLSHSETSELNDELKLSQPDENINNSLTISNMDEEKSKSNNFTSDLKTININLEDSFSESLDFKKLPLQKLRSIVSEKGLSTEASKLKKNELLKLLGVE